MTQVTKETLFARISELESGPRSLKEDFQLEAYRMLLQKMARKQVACSVCGGKGWFVDEMGITRCSCRTVGILHPKPTIE